MSESTGTLTGLTALVTGGSRGIGRAVVQRFAAEGANVVFSYKSNADAAAQVEESVQGSPGSAQAVQADLGQLDGVRGLFATADESLGGLDVVVLNVGDYERGAIAEVSEEAYDKVMGVNARGTFFGLQEAARRVRDDGRIITISSDATGLREPEESVYTASKAAIEQFSGTLAKEVGPRRVTVNVVSPGTTMTDLTRESNTEAQIAEIAKMSPMNRVGEPEEVAGAVAFFAGPDARWLSGENLHVNGGSTIDP